MDTNYQRIIPRDLFNEAKLLKCIGRLCLLIHDNDVPVPMEADLLGESFVVGLMEEGSLSIANLNIKIKGKSYIFKTTYNSKANYPLYLEYEYVDYLVFEEDGNYSKEFIDICKEL